MKAVDGWRSRKASIALLASALGFLFFSHGAGASAVERAPQFSLEKPKGGIISSADMAGKVILLNFWATWCAPCIQEIPALERAFKKHGPQGFMVIGVNFGQQKEQVIRFLDKKPIAYPIALDGDGVFSRQFRVGALPLSILLSSQGEIIRRHVGALTEEQIETWIQESLTK